MSSALTIAVDGPSGSGKSSVSRAVAHALNIGYLDTGAMYRALTWWCQHTGIDVSDWEAVADAARDMPLVQGSDPLSPDVVMDGQDIGTDIRSEAVTSAVSQVATNTLVRPILQQRQREAMTWIAEATGGVVAEGRDITTVVAPDADVRLLLIASEEQRLARRSTEVHGHAEAEALAAIRDQVVARDAADSTVSNFQEAAEGVLVVDTSELDFAQAVQAVLDIVNGRAGS
ncbi:MAG: (d)CMP kinase [Nostocoides sp.]